MGVAKLINVRGSIWVVRGNTYSQMTYLGHLVSLWLPPLANSRRWLDARMPIRRCDLKGQHYLKVGVTFYDLFELSCLQYSLPVPGCLRAASCPVGQVHPHLQPSIDS